MVSNVSFKQRVRTSTVAALRTIDKGLDFIVATYRCVRHPCPGSLANEDMENQLKNSHCPPKVVPVDRANIGPSLGSNEKLTPSEEMIRDVFFILLAGNNQRKASPSDKSKKSTHQVPLMLTPPQVEEKRLEFIEELFELLKPKGLQENMYNLLNKMVKAQLHKHLEGSFHHKCLHDWAIEYQLRFEQLDAEQVGKFYAPNAPREELIKAKKISKQIWELISNKISFLHRSKSPYKTSSQFFGAFGLIGSITDNVPKREQLRKIQQSGKEHQILYQEVMMELAREPIPKEFVQNFPTKLNNNSLEHAYQLLYASDFLDKSKRISREMLDSCDQTVFPSYDKFDRKILLANEELPSFIGVLLEVPRDVENAIFFARMVVVMEICKQEPERVFGYTADGPQHDYDAVKHFDDQIQMIEFLNEKYDYEVKSTFHTAEWTERQVPYSDIYREPGLVIQRAGAKRLGHFTAVKKTDPKNLAILREKKIPVEMCLSLAHLTTGVKAKNSPLKFFLGERVPVVLNTDDEGLSSKNLTTEYEKAWKKCGVGYRKLVLMARCGLEYSFLPGESLYVEDWFEKACNKLPNEELFIHLFKDLRKGDPLSEEAREFLYRNPKARLQYIFEKRMIAYENWVIHDKFKNSVSMQNELPKKFLIKHAAILNHYSRT